VIPPLFRGWFTCCSVSRDTQRSVGGLILLETTGWFKLVYLFRHIIDCLSEQLLDSVLRLQH
jgi:hypothetical protein